MKRNFPAKQPSIALRDTSKIPMWKEEKEREIEKGRGRGREIEEGRGRLKDVILDRI